MSLHFIDRENYLSINFFKKILAKKENAPLTGSQQGIIFAALFMQFRQELHKRQLG